MILERIKKVLQQYKPQIGDAKPIVYITPSHQFQADTLPKSSYDLVLSPHYYWTKVSDRSFKNKAAAKKFAASVFSFDTLHDYEVYNCDEEMVFVAFNPQNIKEMLINQGVNLSLISNIFLSQSFFKPLEKPVMVNENEAIFNLDKRLVVLPLALCEAYDNESSLESFSNDNKVPLKIAGLNEHSLESFKKPLIATGIAFFLWMLMSMINVSQTNNALETLKDEVKQEYKLPQTSFQMKSLLKGLKKTDSKQQFFREILHVLSLNKADLKGSVYSIKVDKNSAVVQFSTKLSSKIQMSIKKSLKSYTKSVSFATLHEGMTMKAQR